MTTIDNPHARHTPADGVNVELLEQTLAHIEAHPESWDQEEWHCATAACFAGWAATLAGGRWCASDSEYLIADEYDHAHACASARGPLSVNVASRAARVLGLTWTGAGSLFAAHNTLADLREQVARLATEERERRARIAVDNAEGTSWPDYVEAEPTAAER